MNNKQKQRLQENFKKKVEQQFSEQLKDFTSEQKQRFFDQVNTLITPQIEDMQATSERIKQRQEEARLFSFGIVVAIIGGCVANILHDTLNEWGLWYKIPALILFVVALLIFRNYFIRKENRDYESDPMWNSLLQEAKRLEKLKSKR